MTTGEKIRKLRKEKGLTQKELGDACDPKIAEPTIGRYERGELNPKFETIQKIAEALEVPIYKIIGIAEEIQIAANAFEDSEAAANAAHDIFSSHDKDSVIALLQEVSNQQRKIVPDEALIAAVDKFYGLNPEDQKIVIDLIKRLYEAEALAKIPEYQKDKTSPEDK